MLVTTNNLTHEKEVLEAMPVDPFTSACLRDIARANASNADAMAQLATRRAEVEARGIPAEYEALADDYAAIGATANAANLRRKAAGMRGVR